MNHTVVGLDLAKNVFHAVELSGAGKQLKRKKYSRAQLKLAFANREPLKIAMEACASSHYWGRLLRAQGHVVELLPPSHVKAYLRGQKNDYNDAQAIGEASLHGALRPVNIKSVEQQDQQALHRIRSLCVADRTALINQIRSLLAEYGLIMRPGIKSARRELPLILEDAENGLTVAFRELLHRQYQRLLALDEEVAWFDEQFARQSRDNEVCRRLREIPGFGPLVASAVAGWLGDGRQFTKGRHAAAAVGLVPRQNTSGDKIRLSGISKRGDCYTRTQLINGARSVVLYAKNKTDALSQWILRVVADRGFNKAIVALANKLIRMAWVIVAKGERYRSLEERGLATALAQ